jgi:hypothetical protein
VAGLNHENPEGTPFRKIRGTANAWEDGTVSSRAIFSVPRWVGFLP